MFIGTNNVVATNPALPLTFTVAQPAVTGATIVVTAADNLQTKYNAASCGDKLVLDAGASWNAGFFFTKQCTAGNWIQIVSSNLGSIPIPSHGTATEVNSNAAATVPNASLYARIRCSTNAVSPLNFFQSGVAAKYHYIAGIEVDAIGQTTELQNLIQVGTNTETLSTHLTDHIWFDRVYVHGVTTTSTNAITRGILASGSYFAVVNSYIADIYSTQDSQAVLLINGPGPFKIDNNYLSAAGEIIMAGGAGASPSYSCTVAAGPAPTTTSATVSSCIDSAAGAVATPVPGQYVMFRTSATAPIYLPTDWVRITSNTAGALTFTATHAAPLAGTGYAKWGIKPADIEITHNYFYKPTTWLPTNPSWDGITRTSKNFIESKEGSRWLIEGNVAANSWAGGQHYALNLGGMDQNGDCAWCVTKDVTLRNNIFKGIAGAIQIIPAASYSGPAPGGMERILIENNLFWPSGVTPYIPAERGDLLLGGYIVHGGTYGAFGGGINSVQYIHNTILGQGVTADNTTLLMSWDTGTARLDYPNFVMRDNILEFGEYRVPGQNACTGTIDGAACVKEVVSNTWSMSNNLAINTSNAVQQVTDATLITRYGPIITACCPNTYAEVGFVNFGAIDSDYHNYALSPGSAYINLASDRKNPGVDFTRLDAALNVSPSGSCSAAGCYRSITIDPAKVPNTSRINFPVLVAGTYSYLATIANGGRVANASGYDVGFYSNSNCSTGKLDWETELYTAATGAVAYWVEVATVSASTNTVIYLCYGNTSITTDQSNKTGVWDANFKGVWHMSDNAASTNVLDSTSGVVTLSNVSNTSTKTATGKIASALTFNGTSDFAGSLSTTIQIAKPITIEAWVNPSGALYRGVFGSDQSGPPEFRIDSDQKLTLLKQGTAVIGTSSGTVTNSTWNHIAVTYDGSGNYAFFINGVASGTGTNSQTFSYPGGVVVEAGAAQGSAEFFKDLLDELRLSSIARSADWIVTSFNNQSNPGSFYAVGSEVSN